MLCFCINYNEILQNASRSSKRCVIARDSHQEQSKVIWPSQYFNTFSLF